jgi:hypothetical protein
MRTVAGLVGVALVAGLGACAPMSGLPDVSVFGGGQADAPAPAGPQDGAGVEVANAPPLPARNVGKRKPKPGTQLAAAPAPAPAPAKEEKQAALSIPSLSDVKLFGTIAYAPDQSNWEGGPIAVYTQLAQQIKLCWLMPGKTKLTNHGFHAEVSPDDSNTAKIVIFEKDPEGKRGVQAFRINIAGSGDGSTVQSENRRLDKDMDAAFKADLVRWSKGDASCKG